MMRNKGSKQTQGLERKLGEMERGNLGFIASSWRIILGLFLIISLPLLLYQNSASYSVWSLRRPEIRSLSGGRVARNHRAAVAPTPAGIENHTLEKSRNVSSPSAILDQTITNLSISSPPSPSPKSHTKKNSNSEKKLLNGLLQAGFDEQSCLSRYESHLYRKPSPHKPSPYLLSKLRSYEQLHRRCGPNSKQYNNTLRKLNGTKQIPNNVDCNYIVWIPINGLGNRMLSLTATFLYAMLTNRVLLVAFEAEMLGVFCEPFLNSTWKLPNDFPYWNSKIDELPTYASLVKSVMESENSRELASSIDVPPFLFVHLQHESKEYERFFHCGEGHMILDRAPYLILRSDQYFVPSLFMIKSFGKEINSMFPEKDTVFHHLGRYLFSPSNEAWREITRFYNTNLSKADKKVGIQVRLFYPQTTLAKTVMDQILGCTQTNNILPKVDPMKNASNNKTLKTRAVLVTSLYKHYSENLMEIYKEGSTTTGEAVLVYQPSHEEVQRFFNNGHHLKALTEMYLLSLCDELVTSGFSTFGYVARGLGAKEAFIMDMRFEGPPCKKALSIEPCFHFAPMYDCERRVQVQHISSVFPHMRVCEDMGVGVKMVGEA